MKNLLAFLTFGLLSATATSASAADSRVFELRVYYAAEGKLDALHARFRDHTTALFAKHGMTNLGYFVPVGENPERKLLYFLAYPDKAARDASWKAFMNDPAWKKAYADSHKDGVLVARAENAFLSATDYSALAAAKNLDAGVFELRTYTTEAGRLPDLNARFRDHTTALFAKHGMTNVAYWNLTADQKGASSRLAADNTLIYLLAHKSEAAAKASFDAFRADPDWIAAKAASEKKAGGSLTISGGVKSEFLKPTDYSLVK
jgi:hypothetical protein